MNHSARAALACLFLVVAWLAASLPVAAGAESDGESLEAVGVRPEVKNPKQAGFIRQKIPMWNFTGEPLPKKWGKLKGRYAMIYCWPEFAELVWLKASGQVVAGVILRTPTVGATHIDGVPLLDREGELVGCAGGWIFLSPRDHALRIRGEDVPIRFSNGKHSLSFGVSTTNVGERECVEGKCWQPVRVEGSYYRIETLKETLLNVELKNMAEIWETSLLEPNLEKRVRENGEDPRDVLEVLLPKLGVTPPGEAASSPETASENP